MATEVAKNNLCINPQYMENISSDSGNTLGIAIQKPKFPQYAVVSKRRESFEKWPRFHPISADVLSEAGLVFIGTADNCRCYHCGGGLRNWEAGDDPWVEHAKWYPDCGHVKLVKGQHFIDAIFNGEHPHNDGGPYETDEAPEDEDYLGTPAALSCLQMGCEEADVTKAISIFIKTKGHRNFKGQDLCEIIFALEESEDDDQSLETDVGPANVADCAQLAPEKSVDELMAENERLRENQTCKICLDKKANVIFLPCGHMVSCPLCATALAKCPMCRLPVQGYVKAFLTTANR